MTVAPIRQPVECDTPAAMLSTAATPSSWAQSTSRLPIQMMRAASPRTRAAEVMLQKIADGEQIEPLRFAPDARSDPEGEHERPQARAAVPPPGGKALMVGVRRGADGRARADVGREERREDQRRAERAVADEELGALLDAAANPDPEQNEADRVADEYTEERRHETGKFT